MSWWTTFVEYGSTAGSMIGSASQWTWNNVLKPTISLSYFTGVQVAKQVAALETAGPALLFDSNTKNVIDNGYQILKNDVFPIVVVNGVNQVAQYYVLEYIEQNPVVVSVMYVTDWAVYLYSIAQGTQTMFHCAEINFTAPSEVNAHKKDEDPSRYLSLCKDNPDCTSTRQLKGKARDTWIYYCNQIPTLIANYYNQQLLATILNAIVTARFINKVAMPNRCEDHTYLTLPSVGAWSLTYGISQYALDWVISKTRLSPFMMPTVLSHLLILLHVHVASHMVLPLEKPEEGAWPVDPFYYYEGFFRLLGNSLYTGGMVHVPKLFAVENPKPLPILPAIKLGTYFLERDLEKDELSKNEFSFFSKAKDLALDVIIPPMFKSKEAFFNDSINRKYWERTRNQSLNLNSYVLMGDNTFVAKIIRKFAGLLAKPIDTVAHKWKGIPESSVEATLNTVNEREFWYFIRALRAWLERHDVHIEITLDETKHESLHLPIISDDSIDVEKKVELVTRPLEEILPVNSPTKLKLDEIKTVEGSKVDKGKKPRTLFSFDDVSSVVIVKKEGGQTVAPK